MAFAAGEEISNAVIKVCKDIGGIMTAVLNPICAVVIGICLLSLIFGKNSKVPTLLFSGLKELLSALYALTV